MNQLGFRVWQYLKYIWEGRSRYYIHSPFVFKLENQVLLAEDSEELVAVEQLRHAIADSQHILKHGNYGAASQSHYKTQISAKDVVKKLSISHKHGKVLYHLCHFMEVKNALELGTAAGLGAAYIAASNPKVNISSIDANPDMTALAKEFVGKAYPNINFETGLFSNLLPNTLKQQEKLDLVYVDGDHQYNSTINYFEQLLPHMHDGSFIIFDDIHWSRDMKRAWIQITKHPKVRVSIDLYRMGIVFFRHHHLEQEHFRLYY